MPQDHTVIDMNTEEARRVVEASLAARPSFINGVSKDRGPISAWVVAVDALRAKTEVRGLLTVGDAMDLARDGALEIGSSGCQITARGIAAVLKADRARLLEVIKRLPKRVALFEPGVDGEPCVPASPTSPISWEAPTMADDVDAQAIRKLTKYPVRFFAMCGGPWFKWSVFSIYPDGQHREVIGPIWSSRTAIRIAEALTQHYRNGYDMGRSATPPKQGSQ